MRLSFPLDYLRLRNAWNRLVVRRDIVPSVLFAGCLSFPFVMAGSANYFHADGFLDKVGGFSSVLLGFYIAALIAVATLSSSFADLDTPITVGEIRRPGTGEPLSRREYVCYMFGYLAFVSLFLSLFAMIVTAVSPSIRLNEMILNIGEVRVSVQPRVIRIIAVVAVSLVLANLAVTTIRGLYYLIERLYDEAPTVEQDRDVN